MYLFNLSFVEKPFFGVNKFYKFKNFENKLNDDEIIIYNFHPSIYFFNKKHEEYSSKKIFHINNIDNTTLIKYADVVITDYSSSVSEAMLLNKPIMFLMENFLTYDRGFIIDKKEFPSIIIESSNISEILNKIRQTNSPNRNVYYTKYRNNIVYKNSLTNIKSFLEELIND